MALAALRGALASRIGARSAALPSVGAAAAGAAPRRQQRNAASAIDLRSDTVTQPSDAMRQAVLSCSVGDDVYGEDPTLNHLQRKAAEMLGKEAALFVPTGCMANLCAIASHCARGDELICGQKSHIFNWEAGHASVLMGVAMHPVANEAGGSLPLEAVEEAIRPVDPHYPLSTLLCLENTQNMCGGRVLSQQYMTEARALCDRRGLKLHVDGARLANAAVALGVSLAEAAAAADSVSLCLSKGLGAPLGSVVAGTEELIYRARRVRKLVGGGMRQAGFVAVAGLLALENVERLHLDHANAFAFAAALATSPHLVVFPVETNIVLFHPRADNDEAARCKAALLVASLQEQGVKVGLAYNPRMIRAVFHLDVSSAMACAAAERVIACAATL